MRGARAGVRLLTRDGDLRLGILDRVSFYPYWSLTLPLRRDLPDQTLRVLQAFATGRPAAEADLATLHAVPAFYLTEQQIQPYLGTPARLYGDARGEGWVLQLDLDMHDDEDAAGGFLYPLWLYSLVERPSGPGRYVLGTSGYGRFDHETKLVTATAAGIETGDRVQPWDEIDQLLTEPSLAFPNWPKT